MFSPISTDQAVCAVVRAVLSFAATLGAAVLAFHFLAQVMT